MKKKELETQANALREAQPREALRLYRTIWTEHREAFTQYDALRTIQCARVLHEEENLAMVLELLES